MESSQDEEECRSSESGWTMYLGSPMEEHSGSTDGDNEDSEEEEQSDCDNVGSVHSREDMKDHDARDEDDDGNGLDSDDSMVSDASSRPQHPGFWARNDENSKQKQRKGGARGKASRKNVKMGKK